MSMEYKLEMQEAVSRAGEGGDALRARVHGVAELLQTRLSAAAEAAPAEMRAAAQRAGERLTEVASGILRGLADALDARRG